MFFDSQSELSVRQDLSQSTGDYPSTNAIDLGVPAPAGVYTTAADRTFIQFNVAEAFASAGGDATLRIRVQTSATENFAAPATVADTGPLTAAQVNAGIDPIALPADRKRFVRLLYTIAEEATTAGTLSARVVLDLQRNHAYPTNAPLLGQKF